MNRKIFYAPSTIKALCEKLIGRLSEDEILDIEETLTRMAICATQISTLSSTRWRSGLRLYEISTLPSTISKSTRYTRNTDLTVAVA